MNYIKLYDILWQVKNAGPSPDNNRRTEIYFAGCNKALQGNPCKHCFNPSLWRNDKSNNLAPQDIVDNLDRHNIPKYVTIVGGEPTDQLPGLIDLITVLKNRGYHIILFSWRSYDWIAKEIGLINLRKIDILVTEPYIEEYRIYDTNLDDGVHNVIGSGNQEVIINNGTDKFDIYKAGQLKSLLLDYSNKLKVVMNTNDNK